MERIAQKYQQRAPRIGILPEMLQRSKIDLAESRCSLVFEGGEERVFPIHSIVNISSNGIKLTLINPDQTPLTGAVIGLEINAPEADKVYRVKGNVCWSENLTGDNAWVGVELKPRPDVLLLFTALTGENP